MIDGGVYNEVSM